MHYQTNRVNHDFQIAYFIAGSCHTPDAAYSILCDLKEDRENAINMFKASEKRELAKQLKINKLKASADPEEVLEGEALELEMQAMAGTVARNLAAAKAELATIEKCIEKLQPLRVYAHLPDPEAHEAAQHDEWKLELIHRAQNSLLTVGHIAPDQFSTMRMHPAFKTEILPAINHISGLLSQVQQGQADPALLQNLITAEPQFNLPKLLPNFSKVEAVPQITAG